MLIPDEGNWCARLKLVPLSLLSSNYQTKIIGQMYLSSQISCEIYMEKICSFIALNIIAKPAVD